MLLPESVSLLLQVGFLLILAKCIFTIYELFQGRWQLQRLTKSFGDLGGKKVHFMFGDLNNLPPDGQGREEKFLECAIRWKNIGRIWLGPFMVKLVTVSPDFVKEVLANAGSKDNLVYNFVRPWMGDGLLTVSEGLKWSRHRKLLTPGFHYEVLKPYFKICGDATQVYLDVLANSNGNFIDVFRPVSLLTLDNLLKCSFSYESNCQEDGDNPYIKAIYELTKGITERSRFIPYHNESIFYISPLGRRFVENCRIVHDKAETTIRERKRELDRLASANEAIPRRGRNYMDFLDILIEAKDENGESMSDLEIRDEVDTFLFEGHDTTASGISWCLYNLAKYPEYQQQCREEVQQILLDKENDIIEWDDLAKLEFTTLFIKESMRIRPPVPAIARTCDKELTFPDGTKLPKGTFVGVSILALHNHPLYWKDPDVFNPYRFTLEGSRGRHSHAYIPFSAGQRNCIGQKFALNETKVVIAMTVHRFLIELDPKKIPQMLVNAVLRSYDGIHLRFIPV